MRISKTASEKIVDAFRNLMLANKPFRDSHWIIESRTFRTPQRISRYTLFKSSLASN